MTTQENCCALAKEQACRRCRCQYSKQKELNHLILFGSSYLSFHAYLYLDIYCRLCGSSATGIGFHKATVDISLKFDIEVYHLLLGFKPIIKDVQYFLF